MAFSNVQVVSIRKYLGYPQVFIIDNYRLNGAIINIGEDADKQAFVVGLLAQLDAVDTVLQTGGSVIATQGALKKVDEIEFYDTKLMSAGTTINAMVWAKMLANRLSKAMAVPINGDGYFGDDGYTDDEWSREGFQIGGVIPLG